MDYFKNPENSIRNMDRKHAKIILGAEFCMFDDKLRKLGYDPVELRKIYCGENYEDYVKEFMYRRFLEISPLEENSIQYNICSMRDTFEIPDGFTDYGTDEEYTYTIFRIFRDTFKVEKFQFKHCIITYGNHVDLDELTLTEKGESSFLEIFHIFGVKFFRKMAVDFEPEVILKNFT